MDQTQWAENSEGYKSIEGEGPGRKRKGRGQGKTDGGVRGILGYLQITSLPDRFVWRPNWARGLRGNQSKS